MVTFDFSVVCAESYALPSLKRSKDSLSVPIALLRSTTQILQEPAFAYHSSSFDSMPRIVMLRQLDKDDRNEDATGRLCVYSPGISSGAMY